MITFRLWAYLGAAGVLLLLWGWALNTAYQAGRQAEQAAFLNRINVENENAGDIAEKWRGDLRRCIDAGGVYDFETGACDK